MMRIVHVVESFGGGVIGFVAQLVERLPACEHIVFHAVRQGEVDVSVTRGRFPPGTRFEVWPGAVREVSLWADVRALRGLLSRLPVLRPDVVHLHSSKAGALGRVACRWLGLPCVYTAGGAAFLRADVSPTARRTYAFFEKLASRFGGKVVACALSEQDAFGRLGIQAELIANGVVVPPEPTARPGGGTSLTVITTARATAQKNPQGFAQVARLVDAGLAALGRTGLVRFVWVGDGELAHELAQVPYLTLTGWQTAAQVQAHLAGADVYLSTSHWEGLSLSVLEAMAAGLPLLLSAVPGNTDAVTEEVNGRTFSTPAQAAEHLIAWAQEPTALGLLGLASHRISGQDHNLDQVAARYMSLYQSLDRKTAPSAKT